MLNVEIENQLRCVESTDAKEGMLAFLEKRAPSFRGI
jgi:enoyl-CoA hydratase/carnithine racemase